MTIDKLLSTEEAIGELDELMENCNHAKAYFITVRNDGIKLNKTDDGIYFTVYKDDKVKAFGLVTKEQTYCFRLPERK